MIKHPLWILVTLVALAACGGEEQTTPEEPPADLGAIIEPTDPIPSVKDRTMREGFAPTPFTAEQIRKGCPDGRVIVFRVSHRGAKPVEEMWRFDKGDEKGVDYTLSNHTIDGKALGTPTTSRRWWTDLQQHASFPLEATTIEDAVLEVAGKRYACWHYTQQLLPGGEQRAPNQSQASQVRKQEMWFAKALPGPPVKMLVHMDGALIHDMVLHENRMP
ncbi:MAG: hypothetical protein GY946_34210 [bacterium]|nr:hypothetical protein [bacterium]